jgi:hypothetical protein
MYAGIADKKLSTEQIMNLAKEWFVNLVFDLFLVIKIYPDNFIDKLSTNSKVNIRN